MQWIQQMRCCGIKAVGYEHVPHGRTCSTCSTFHGNMAQWSLKSEGGEKVRMRKREANRANVLDWGKVRAGDR